MYVFVLIRFCRWFWRFAVLSFHRYGSFLVYDVLVDPRFINIAYELVLAFLKPFKLEFRYTIGNISDDSLIDVGETDFACIDDLTEVPRKVVVPDLIVYPTKLQEICCHHNVEAILILDLVHFLIEFIISLILCVLLFAVWDESFSQHDLLDFVITIGFDSYKVNDPFESISIAVHGDFNSFCPVHTLDDVGKVGNVVVFLHPFSLNEDLLRILLAIAFLNEYLDETEVKWLAIFVFLLLSKDGRCLLSSFLLYLWQLRCFWGWIHPLWCFLICGPSTTFSLTIAICSVLDSDWLVLGFRQCLSILLIILKQKVVDIVGALYPLLICVAVHWATRARIYFVTKESRDARWCGVGWWCIIWSLWSTSRILVTSASYTAGSRCIFIWYLACLGIQMAHRSSRFKSTSLHSRGCLTSIKSMSACGAYEVLCLDFIMTSGINIIVHSNASRR